MTVLLWLLVLVLIPASEWVFDQYTFVSMGFATDDFHLLFWHLELFGKKLNQMLIRLAINRRRFNAYFQQAILYAGKFIL